MTGTPTREASPFHQGEKDVQARMGVHDIEDWARKAVRDHMPEQHRAFYVAQPFLVAAARDGQGRPWVTLLSGPDGFVTTPDPHELLIDAAPVAGDALEHAFTQGADIGILGIELATRRRNRVNGRLGASGGVLSLVVDQSFGNCPQYIRERAWKRVADNTPGAPVRGHALSARQKDWISSADTFFIASGFRAEGESPTFGMDASHRGGEPGFVEVLDDRRIRFPDYAGNNHYNTIGNLVLEPKAGFLFIDFTTGSLLQLTGTASIDWDPQDRARFPGARRLVTLAIDEIVELPSALDLRWEADAGSVRSLRVIDKIVESADVTSFHFEARDGGALPAFEPGQHLPIELRIPGVQGPVSRTYSLSSAPADAGYRISVKREPEGQASRFLHDRIEPGAILESRRPAGDFVMTCAACPLVLVSAGVGLTPMVSILRTVAAEGGARPVWFVHGARDGAHHPLREEVRQIAAVKPNVQVHAAYSRPRPEDKLGADYESEGRMSGALLAGMIDNRDAHYFLCGPVRFMADIQDALEAQGVPADQIHTETFGPGG